MASFEIIIIYNLIIFITCIINLDLKKIFLTSFKNKILK